MKLANSKFFETLEFECGSQTLVVENVELLRTIILQLKFQINNKIGDFILSDNDEILDISKNILLITDVFEISGLSKQLKNKLQQYVESSYDNDDLYQDVYQKLIEFGNDLTNSSPYPLCFNQEISKFDIIKLLDIQFEHNYSSLLEEVIDYIDIFSQIIKTKLFVFVSLRSFLTDEEFNNFMKIMDYKGIRVLLIERYLSLDNGINNNVHIIDKDLCVI
jgi:CRISPR-associated protein, csn2 family